MSQRQLMIIIGATTALALTLAWLVERAQVRRFMGEFQVWAEKMGMGGDHGTD